MKFLSRNLPHSFTPSKSKRKRASAIRKTERELERERERPCLFILRQIPGKTRQRNPTMQKEKLERKRVM
jgi:hypothetical protein